MKYLVMCEGSNEKAVVDNLIKNKKFLYSSDELIGLTSYVARQLTKDNPAYSVVSQYNKPFEILVIGDTKKEEIKIPKEFSKLVTSKDIKKYHTKPELEILLIINQNLVKEYRKSGLTPKEFSKKYIKHNKIKYNNSKSFWENYYLGKSHILSQDILEYKRIKNHTKKEFYLADLIIDNLK